MNPASAAPDVAPSAVVPDASGHFGGYGGRFVPESLISALDELQTQYLAAKADPEFQAELDALLRGYAGRPTLVTRVPRFSEAAGCEVLLKREDLLTPALTRSTMCSGRCCWPSAWARPG